MNPPFELMYRSTSSDFTTVQWRGSGTARGGVQWRQWSKFIRFFDTRMDGQAGGRLCGMWGERRWRRQASRPLSAMGQPAKPLVLPSNADRKWVMASKSPSMHKTPDGTGQQPPPLPPPPPAQPQHGSVTEMRLESKSSTKAKHSVYTG